MGQPGMQPTGWFQVAWSADLDVGDVMPLRYFGEELVAFRDLDGAVRVLDAHCRHLGADLSHGGCVVEGGIQCPLHGWVWSGEDGRNVRIPYERWPVPDRRVRYWPVTERNECIYIWHGPEDSDPDWSVPDMHDDLDAPTGMHYFRPVGPDEKQFFPGVSVPPQLVVENTVDVQHYRFVHRVPLSPTVLASAVNHSTWHAKLAFGAGDPVEVWWYGLGLCFKCEDHGDGRQIVSVCPTPVDDTTIDIFATYWVSEDLDYDDRLLAVKRLLADDIPIWGHQRYQDDPVLAPSEADDFKHLRDWARGFYPDRRNVTL
jgi:nitrite reductase/ring-hydroxylating ferredoxin subunit